jgi:hypothetical protein
MADERNKIIHGYPLKLVPPGSALPVDASTELEYLIGPSSFAKSHQLFDPANGLRDSRTHSN